ncbi:aldo/keto reductase [Rhodovarius crocodyli]|uniref:Aldo/keto reductase n=1 Tax=Rhodovarius crocodyli TaxID=1979269 RepID=A0A437MMS7_9PROT|nr:aldo/keto reductase [Rhodovarius crocodyli]RVT98954.1 aldo/keto reductase [Rhodovarius crocodyli]
MAGLLGAVKLLETSRMRMPSIGLGTWPMKGAECEAAVEGALGLGYRHLDTAEMYGNEVEVGRGLKASGLKREEVFLTTKGWWDKSTGPALRAAAEASLDRLSTPYLDLYLIHWPSPQMDLPGLLEALAKLQQDGLAKAVGVANFPAGLLSRALALGIAPIACDQVEHHALLSQEKLLKVCAAHDVVLTSYTPLGKGRVGEHPVVAGIAARLGVMPGQVALAYALAQGPRHGAQVSVIPKAAGTARQTENLGAAGVFLSEADLAAIDALPKDQRMVNPDFRPNWND